MKEFWNERYSRQEYVYGQLPNEYLKEKLASLIKGKVLFPCEGEGRNAVYAAKLGWNVSAFDQSEAGKIKAEALANNNNVGIDYSITTVQDANYPIESFDALALIYAHFPEQSRKNYHQKLSTFLKRGGILIIEGFSKKHAEYQKTNPNVGGPKDIEMLYDLDELKKDFINFDFKEALETDIVLSEGAFHKGNAAVVRILAIKK